MKNWLLILIALITLTANPSVSRAAFIVTPKTAEAVPVHVKKPFMQRKLPMAIAAMTHAPRPEDSYRDHSKPGWPGAVAFGCSLLAIAGLFIPYAGVTIYLLASICAIIFGGIGVSKRKYSNTGFAIAGLVLGILEILALIALIVLLVALLAAL